MKRIFLYIAIVLSITTACTSRVQYSDWIEAVPEIFPDYVGVTVPCNIAPLDFSYVGDDSPCRLQVNGGVTIKGRKDGLFVFPRRLWKKLMEYDSVDLTVLVKQEGRWLAFRTFSIYVSRDKIDPYLAYRLLPPGYQGWRRMGVYQRNLENYTQTPVYENSLTAENCINCHSFCDRNPEKMSFHIRSSFSGTYILNGDNLEKLNTKTDSTMSAFVYPYWHPDGKHIAYSVNKTPQSFFNHDPNRIEVYDEDSDVIIYNTETHKVLWSPVTKDPEMFETFPCFSPDGTTLYFCSAPYIDNLTDNFDESRYAIYRTWFDAATETFSDSLELVYDKTAEGISASYPRVSPDGRYLAFTVQSYGGFAIWHKDSELAILDLQSGDSWLLEEANSDDVESYHTWSSNSHWLVVSSRRTDGLYTRPHFVHIDDRGRASKAFLLPQKNPGKYYHELMVSYNIPEFVAGKVKMDRHKASQTMRNDPGIYVSPK